MTELITIQQVKKYINANFTGNDLATNSEALKFTPQCLINLSTDDITRYRETLYSQGYVFIKLYDTSDEESLINLSLSNIVTVAKGEPSLVDPKYPIVKNMRKIASQIVRDDFNKFNVFHVIAKNCPNQPYHVDQGVISMGTAINGESTLISQNESTQDIFKKYGLEHYSDEEIKTYLDENPEIKYNIQLELQQSSITIPKGYFAIWLSRDYQNLSFIQANSNINRATWHASPECLNTGLSIVDSRKFLGAIVKLK